MLLPHIDIKHLNKDLFNFSYFPVFTLVVLVVNFEKFQRFCFFFVFLPGSKSTTRNTEFVFNMFISHIFFKFFQCFVLHFQSHFMMLPFCGHFYCVSHQRPNSNKFKDFKTFEYYGIRIETFELTTLE